MGIKEKKRIDNVLCPRDKNLNKKHIKGINFKLSHAGFIDSGRSVNKSGNSRFKLNLNDLFYIRIQ